MTLPKGKVPHLGKQYVSKGPNIPEDEALVREIKSGPWTIKRDITGEWIARTLVDYASVDVHVPDDFNPNAPETYAAFLKHINSTEFLGKTRSGIEDSRFFDYA